MPVWTGCPWRVGYAQQGRSVQPRQGPGRGTEEGGLGSPLPASRRDCGFLQLSPPPPPHPGEDEERKMMIQKALKITLTTASNPHAVPGTLWKEPLSCDALVTVTRVQGET